MLMKTAIEEIYLYHEFLRPDGNGWLASGETITAATVTVADKQTGADTSSAMVAQAAPFNGTQVKYLAKGGTVGKTYRFSIVITTSNVQTFEDSVEVKVI